jgi:hypothetical protein
VAHEREIQRRFRVNMMKLRRGDAMKEGRAFLRWNEL